MHGRYSRQVKIPTVSPEAVCQGQRDLQPSVSMGTLIRCETQPLPLLCHHFSHAVNLRVFSDLRRRGKHRHIAMQGSLQLRKPEESITFTQSLHCFPLLLKENINASHPYTSSKHKTVTGHLNELYVKHYCLQRYGKKSKK